MLSRATCCQLTRQGGAHHQGDVLPLLSQGWDILIAFPPCTYLCSSGMHWTVRGLRDPQLTEDALNFVRCLMDAPIKHIAIENPVGCISSRIRKPDCIIQPWQFGHNASKTTCLWLKNLPPLQPTNILQKPASGRWKNQTPSGQNNLGPSKDRWKERSKTYQGIADAMAAQWSAFVLSSQANLESATAAESLGAKSTLNTSQIASASAQATPKMTAGSSSSAMESFTQSAQQKSEQLPLFT